MPYATTPQLEAHLGADRFVDLTDRDRSGAPDDAAVAEALAGASSIADSYLASYLPIATAPLVLVEAVLDIAIYRLAGNRRTEDERLRYEDAMRWLRDVSTGKAALGLPDGAVASTESEVTVEAADAEHTWTQTRGVL